MRVVVSDTSPLHYLVLIGAIDLLPRIASEVLIPPAVAQELGHKSTPDDVRVWMMHPPAWLKITAPQKLDTLLGLDLGETEAISLALELGVDSILIDERKGFRVAAARGLKPIGLLAVLEFCAANGWIEIEDYIARLRKSTFRLHDRVLSGIRERLKNRIG